MKQEAKLQALKDYLESQYQQAIQAVNEQANKEEARILAEYKQRGEEQAQALLQARRRASKQERINAVSQKKTRCRDEEDHAVAQLVQEVKECVRQEKHGLSTKKKQSLLEAYKQGISKEIQQRGLDNNTFSYAQDNKQLSVQASNQELLFEDGVEKRLEEQEDTIKERIQEQLQ